MEDNEKSKDDLSTTGEERKKEKGGTCGKRQTPSRKKRRGEQQRNDQRVAGKVDLKETNKNGAEGKSPSSATAKRNQINARKKTARG